jgi:hypothetical protein
MSKRFSILFFLVSLILLSCGSAEEADILSIEEFVTPKTYDWIVSKNDLTGSDDPFPFAENPTTTSINSVTGLKDSDIVVVVSFKNEIRVYPYKFISPFEVVNDKIGDTEYAVKYCPVTESGVVVENSFENESSSFIASGFRYKDNLISLDKNSNTYWSQMLLKCIKGKYENEFHKTLTMVELSWKLVKEFFPNAKVFKPTSISNKISNRKNNNDIGIDERVFGNINFDKVNGTSVNIYRKSDFNESISLFETILNNSKTITIGSSELDFIVSFIIETDNTFTTVQNEFPVILKDETGSMWNVFGLAVSGSRKGDQLQAAKSYKASWWAWKNFYSQFNFIE